MRFDKTRSHGRCSKWIGDPTKAYKANSPHSLVLQWEEDLERRKVCYKMFDRQARTFTDDLAYLYVGGLRVAIPTSNRVVMILTRSDSESTRDGAV